MAASSIGAQCVIDEREHLAPTELRILLWIAFYKHFVPPGLRMLPGQSPWQHRCQRFESIVNGTVRRFELFILRPSRVSPKPCQSVVKPFQLLCKLHPLVFIDALRHAEFSDRMAAVDQQTRLGPDSPEIFLRKRVMFQRVKRLVEFQTASRTRRIDNEQPSTEGRCVKLNL